MAEQPPQFPPVGRSRGRARVAAGPTTVPQMPAPLQPGSQITPRPVPQSNIPAAEPGRGRGLPAKSSSSTTTTTTSSSSGGDTSQKPSVSPKGGSSEDSPPQQHSPTVIMQSGAGRAALRSQPHQPSIGNRLNTGVIGAETAAEDGTTRQQRVTRIDAVPFMKPASCAEKKGESGTPVQIFCNYYEIVGQPDWILYQYHVEFAPLVDSKRTRMLLMKPHDYLFKNKAFDGSTIYSLTKLEMEVRGFF